MTSSNIHNALLRPAVLQILRAAGFHSTRPAVLDIVTDLAARYLLLLASSTAQLAFNNHNSYVPTVQDVRLALMAAGALSPQMGAMEEHARDSEDVDEMATPFEDLRGIRAFVEWAQGDSNKEIRRIAGLGDEEGAAELAAELGEIEDDYVTALKKKHAKTDTEARYQGTALGRDADEAPVTIVGGPTSSISDWAAQVRSKSRSRTMSPDQSSKVEVEGATPATSGISSLPSTPMDGEIDDQDEMEL